MGELDHPLLILWAVLSVATAGVFGLAVWRLLRLQRSWHPATVRGRAVWIAEDLGPAVAGILGRQVVLPPWVLALDESRKALVLTHEEEHLRARDHWLLGVAAIGLIAMPWNIGLWWHVRRLRVALELDCDARVLRRTGDLASYGSLLLDTGRQTSRRVLYGAALGESASTLERRIRAIAARRPRFFGLRVAALAGAAVLLTGAACESPYPTVPVSGLTSDTSMSGDAAASLVHDAVYDRLPELLSRPETSPIDLWILPIGRPPRAGYARWTPRGPATITTRDVHRQLPFLGPDVVSSWSTAQVTGILPRNVRAIIVQLRGRSELVQSADSELLRRMRHAVMAFYPRLISTPAARPLDVQVDEDTLTGELRAHTVLRNAFWPVAPVREGYPLGAARSDVRVLWVRTGHLRPGVEEPWQENGFSPSLAYLRALVKRYHPEVLGHGSQPAEIVAFVFDARDSIVRDTVVVRLSAAYPVERMLSLFSEFAHRRFNTGGIAGIAGGEDEGASPAPGSVWAVWASFRHQPSR